MADPKELEPKEPKPKESKAKEAKPKEPKDQKPKAKKEEKGALEATAEAIGSTLGTIAAAVGVEHPEKKAASPKKRKLLKKNRQRMPRKLKKRLLKGAAPSK